MPGPKIGKPSTSNDKTEQEPGGATISETDLADSLADLKTCLLGEMKKSFDQVNDKLDGLQETVNTHSEHLDALEEDTESLGHPLSKVEDCCKVLQDYNAKLKTKLKAKLADLEGRSRRANVQLIGIQENIEGPQPSKFFAQLLQDVFGQDIFPSPPELDRAHRSFAAKPGPGNRPRPVIVCFHRYQNKDLVIWEARKRRTLMYQNTTFRIYEDCSPEVVIERKKYAAVMSELYKMGLKPSLLYPARLRITNTDGTRIAFGSVVEAEKFVNDSKTPEWLVLTLLRHVTVLRCKYFSVLF